MATSVTFRIGTCNLRSLPLHWKVMVVIASTLGLHLVGFQEADPPRYKRRLRKRWPGIIGLGPTNNNTYSTPIAYSRKRFHLVESLCRKLYDGVDGISLTRHVTRAIFEEKKTNLLVGMVNLHGPVVKDDEKKSQRLALRLHSKNVARNQVTDLLSRGIPVVVTGDFNDKTNWFSSLRGSGYGVLRIGGGIDQIILISPSGYRWELLSKRSVDTPSDHNTLRTRVRLTKL